MLRTLVLRRTTALPSSCRGISSLPRLLTAAGVRRNAFAAQPLLRSFSQSCSLWSEGATDSALLEKLTEEITYENEAADAAGEGPGQVPSFIQAFKTSGVWSIHDVPGQDEVTLTRQFGNENIKLMFSIADLQNEEPSEDEDLDEDENSENEGQDGQRGDTASGESPSSEELQSYPIRVNMSITKSGGKPGALVLDMAVQEGTFIVENISYYQDEKLGTELTAEGDWKRRGLYIGPQFDTLDLGVQEEFDAFIAERGLDANLALFIPEYAEWKEQKEYVGWLKGVKSFIAA